MWRQWYGHLRRGCVSAGEKNASAATRLSRESVQDRHAIRAEQIRLLYEQLPSALIATTIVGGLVVYVLWSHVSVLWLALWVLALAATTASRIWLMRAFFATRPSGTDSGRWGRRFLWGVLVSGLVWGCVGVVPIAPGAHLHELFLLFVLAGLAAGAMSTLSSFRGAYAAFLVPAILPFAVKLMLRQGEMYVAMSWMLYLFIAMMSLISARHYRSITESLRLRFENSALVEDLAAAHDRQQAINKELAEQIHERERIGEALRRAHDNLEAKIEQRTEQLAQADRRKDEFLAMLGHELRNPLAAICNALELVKIESRDDPKLKRFIGIMERQTRNLTRLVEDLVQISRVSRGRIELRPKPISLGKVVADAVQETETAIGASLHHLHLDLPEPTPVVLGDPTRLTQIFTNLLTNARRYTQPGGDIWISARTEGGQAIVRVRDSGIGINRGHLPHIFDLFYQVSRLRDTAQDGLGVGLALVKSLVELHRGSIEVNSDGEGKGSEFVVRLPLTEHDVGTELQAALVPAINKIGSSRRILVVDDEPDMTTTLAVFLRMQGHEVQIASDGEEAVRVARAFRPDVILLDIGLPNKDGYEVARLIRAEEAGKRMLLIAQTGRARDEDRQLAEQAGFNHFLTKPIEFKDLQRLIQTGAEP
jgi:signal transduction histidine kinase